METYAKGDVYQRNRVWYLDYWLHGKRVRESAKTTNKQVAERLLHKKLSEIDEGTYTHIQKAKRVGFNDFVERYLQTYDTGRKSWRVNKATILKPLKEFFGNIVLTDIQPAQIQDYKAKRIKDEIQTPGVKTKRTVQTSTVNRSISALVSLFNKAVEEGLLVSNPCTKVKGLLYSEKGRARQRFLEEAEIKALLNASEYPVKQIVEIALGTGCRRGEISGLRWSDIQYEAGTITLRNTKNGEVRQVLMTKTVKDAILSVRKNPNSDLLFPGSNLTKPWDFRKPFESVVKKAGLNVPGKEKLCFHHLRHTFCSQLGLLGFDVVTIMSLSGHKSYQMALRYTKLNTEHKMKALERLEAKISDKNNVSTVTQSDTNEVAVREKVENV